MCKTEFISSLIGLAVGDSLGAPYEFRKPKIFKILSDVFYAIALSKMVQYSETWQIIIK